MFSDLYESHKRIETDKKTRSAQNTKPETMPGFKPILNTASGYVPTDTVRRPVVTLSPEAARYYCAAQAREAAGITRTQSPYVPENRKPAKSPKSTMISRLRYVLGI